MHGVDEQGVDRVGAPEVLRGDRRRYGRDVIGQDGRAAAPLRPDEGVRPRRQIADRHAHLADLLTGEQETNLVRDGPGGRGRVGGPVGGDLQRQLRRIAGVRDEQAGQPHGPRLQDELRVAVDAEVGVRTVGLGLPGALQEQDRVDDRVADVIGEVRVRGGELGSGEKALPVHGRGVGEEHLRQGPPMKQTPVDGPNESELLCTGRKGTCEHRHRQVTPLSKARRFPTDTLGIS